MTAIDTELFAPPTSETEFRGRARHVGQRVLRACDVMLQKVDRWVAAPNPAQEAMAQGAQDTAHAYARAHGVRVIEKP